MHGPAADLPDSAYPSADGEPVAESSDHFDFIAWLHGNLDAALPDAFVGADLLVYPVRNQTRDCLAPDVMVALGRPKGVRKSWLPWNEDGRFPDVVIEGLPLSTTWFEMLRKLAWYERHGAREVFAWDLVRRQLTVWRRDASGLAPLERSESYTSELLGCRFDVVDGALTATGPDGEPFKTVDQLRTEAAAARSAQRAAQARAEALEARLRAMGIDPDAP